MIFASFHNLITIILQVHYITAFHRNISNIENMKSFFAKYEQKTPATQKSCSISPVVL